MNKIIDLVLTERTVLMFQSVSMSQICVWLKAQGQDTKLLIKYPISTKKQILNLFGLFFQSCICQKH